MAAPEPVDGPSAAMMLQSGIINLFTDILERLSVEDRNTGGGGGNVVLVHST